MVLYNSDLYNKIIYNEGLESTYLKIISGYASAELLKSVIIDFPNLNIDLFIGMYKDGISVQNHTLFKKIMLMNSNIRVFYQYEGKQTHVKLYEFKSKDTNSVYVGSANFTENGFFNNHEILARVDGYVGSIFKDMENKSLLCIDNRVDEFITIFNDPPTSMNLITEEESRVVCYRDVLLCNDIFFVHECENESKKSKKRNKILNKTRYKIDEDYHDFFSMEIVLSEENDRRWRMTGINRIFDDKLPSIFETNRIPFYKVFPDDSIFKIYSDEGKLYQAKLVGLNKKDLVLIDGNFYEYVKKKINLQEYRPISRYDLLEYGETKINFERLDSHTYYMSFNK